MKLDYLDFVSMKYGRFKVSEYLKSSGHKYAIFLMDFSKQAITYYDGLDDEELKENCKKSLGLFGKNMYALYGEEVCSTSEEPVEVFMIKKEFWESHDDKEKELLVFHEVSHLIERRKYYIDLGVVLSEYELRIGKKLSELADKAYNDFGNFGEDEHHNQIFGAVLFHFLSLYDPETCFHLLSDSMLYNIGYDTTHIFKEVT